MSAAEIASVISEIDIFAHRHIQTSVLGKIDTAYKTIAPSIKRSGILYTCYNDTYLDLDIKFYIQGKLISCSGKDVDSQDHRP